MRVVFLTAAVLAARFRDRLGLSVGVLVGLGALALGVVGTVAAAGALELIAFWKLPSPLPNSTETSAETTLATTKSGLPSRFKSPAATSNGPVWAP